MFLRFQSWWVKITCYCLHHIICHVVSIYFDEKILVSRCCHVKILVDCFKLLWLIWAIGGIYSTASYTSIVQTFCLYQIRKEMILLHSIFTIFMLINVTVEIKVRSPRQLLLSLQCIQNYPWMLCTIITVNILAS